MQKEVRIIILQGVSWYLAGVKKEFSLSFLPQPNVQQLHSWLDSLFWEGRGVGFAFLWSLSCWLEHQWPDLVRKVLYLKTVMRSHALHAWCLETTSLQMLGAENAVAKERHKQALKIHQGDFSIIATVCNPLPLQGNSSRLCMSQMRTVKLIPANVRPVN